MSQTVLNINLEAVVNYRTGQACYKIDREKPGVYSAMLVYYEGEKTEIPPMKITLVRGIRQWTGSYSDESLLMELGSRIEQALAS